MIEYSQHDVITESSHQGLSLQKPIYSQDQKHAARSRISDCLLRDKWIPEGITLKEKSIEENTNQIQHLFENELTVLQNDARISNHRRHKRFAQILDRAVAERCDKKLECQI